MFHRGYLLFFSILMSLSLSSCSYVVKRVDNWMFESFGGTIFTNPTRVTLKKIHLDNSDLIGKNLIVSGKVEKIGEYGTYVIISADSVKLLVVLTNISFVEKWLEENKPQSINVLGQLDIVRKGYPLFIASALQKK